MRVILKMIYLMDMENIPEKSIYIMEIMYAVKKMEKEKKLI